MNVTIEMVAVGKLKIADDNIRSDVGDVGELAASIKSIGVLEPLLVNTDMVVVCGARRLAASKKAGLKEVPAIVRAFTEQERVETMVVENLQREDLTALEEAEAYKRLEDLGLTQREIAAKVGVSQATVTRRLGLLVLPDPVRAKVDSGEVKLDDAIELARLKDPKKIAAVMKKSPTAITYNVQQELAKDKREKKLATITRQLTKEGEKVVEMKLDAYGYGAKLPEGMKLVQLNAGYADAVEMDPGKHAKLDCHAVAIKGDGETVEVCTDPASHGPTQAEKRRLIVEQADVTRAKEREQRELNTQRRHEFLLTTLAGKPQQPLVLDVSYLALMSDVSNYYGENEMELACDLLQVEVVDLDDLEADLAAHEGDEIPDAIDLLVRKARESAADKLRVTLAVAIAKLELLDGWQRPMARDAVIPYLELLVGLGYEASAEEKEWMAPPAEPEVDSLVEIDGVKVAEVAHVDLVNDDSEEE